jgi:hypothetical protein
VENDDHFLAKRITCEFFLASVMLAFADRSVVKKVVNFLPRVGVGGRYGLPQQR